MSAAVAAQRPIVVPAGLDLIRPDAVGLQAPRPDSLRHVVVDPALEALVDDLLRRSSAFRRQWQRLNRSRQVTVRLVLVHARHTGDAHASTEITQHADGALSAVVAIPGGTRLAELIAHEVEHILERLDGASVAEQHALGDASVRRSSGTFETARAVLAGRRVATDVQPR